MNPFDDIQKIFSAAVAAVHPQTLIRQTVSADNHSITFNDDTYPIAPHARVVVIGAGKAAAAMGAALENILLPHLPISGVVVTKYDHALPLQQLELLEAAHPVPDENSVLATQKILAAVSGLQSGDLVILLLSGGASALLADVPEGCTLPDVQQLFQLLLHSGANIEEMNTVRKHLSAVKGGQLAKRIYPATLCTLIISDVPGDKLEVIGSGPGVPDPTTFAQTMAILERYQLTTKIPAAILRYFRKGLAGEVPETPKPGDPIFNNVHNYLNGSNRVALTAAAKQAMALGYEVVLSGDVIAGEAKIAGKELANTALEYDKKVPACLLQGGETTVTIKGNGKGGRNQELMLSTVKTLQEKGYSGNNLTFLSAGTDGTDGPTNAAGAIADAYTLQQASLLKLGTTAFLDNNDAWNFFNQVDRLFITGATQTNVMDIQIVLIT
ncbi:glycerate kinase [Chitinophaga sp. sic0106]|uniref:glycerate kinase type-2 family protein n=1 Tax=Chitinophaga sp. sic0106 TaxID=2854785 RepID=UPI001C43FBE8|nr:glycerate kinase [Chitinophaga sp. sic0106]MBV7533875.1 glycerate kinase [Chitinophaga sp. sic0106]